MDGLGRLAFADELLKLAAMKTRDVESSNLSSIGYDPKTQTLEVTFHNGGKYRYNSIPPNIYRNLMRAKSKGKAFHRMIAKPKVPHEKLETAAPAAPAAPAASAKAVTKTASFGLELVPSVVTGVDLAGPAFSLMDVGARAARAAQMRHAAQVRRQLLIQKATRAGAMTGAAIAGALIGRELGND